MWISVYPNEKWTLTLKMDERDVFFWNKASISFIPMRRMCLWCLKTKKKEIIMWIPVYPIEKRTSIGKMIGRDVFFQNQRLNIIYPNEENVFVVPNNKKKRDYYVNPCLSNWKMNINSKNGWKRCFLLKPKTQYHLSKEENVLMVPNN